MLLCYNKAVHDELGYRKIHRAGCCKSFDVVEEAPDFGLMMGRADRDFAAASGGSCSGVRMMGNMRLRAPAGVEYIPFCRWAMDCRVVLGVEVVVVVERKIRGQVDEFVRSFA